MSYRAMSNREGNQQRIMEMKDANMPTGVIAAYMTEWEVPMTSQDVQGIINTFESMGDRAVKKSDVQQAIATHQRYIEPLKQHQPSIQGDEESGMQDFCVNLNVDCDDER